MDMVALKDSKNEGGSKEEFGAEKFFVCLGNAAAGLSALGWWGRDSLVGRSLLAGRRQ